MSISTIEWTEQTWNPIVGCSLKSPGCTHCYAMGMAARIEAMNAAALPGHETAPHYAGTTRKVNGAAVWTGKIAMAADEVLLAPLRRKKPTVYFVNSMGDLFHEDCPDQDIDRVVAVMLLAKQHTFQVLTKRAARMRAYFAAPDLGTRIHIAVVRHFDDMIKYNLTAAHDWPLPNIWLGVSTERQQEADEQIPDLLATPAAIRFISYEPALGPIDLEPWLAWPDNAYVNDKPWGCIQCDAAPCDCPKVKAVYIASEGPLDKNGVPSWIHADRRTLDWVIAGGESGPKARPMHPDWARSLRDQCAAAGVDFFFKQWGEFAPYDRGQVDTRKLQMPKSLDGPTQRFGKKLAGRLLDGVEHNAMPSLRRTS